MRFVCYNKSERVFVLRDRSRQRLCVCTLIDNGWEPIEKRGQWPGFLLLKKLLDTKFTDLLSYENHSQERKARLQTSKYTFRCEADIYQLLKETNVRNVSVLTKLRLCF